MRFTAKLLQIIQAMSNHSLLEAVLKNAKKNYVFNEKDFKSLNSESVLKLFSTKTSDQNDSDIDDKNSIQQINNNPSEIFWHPNQFKVFVWISVCYAHIENKEISTFNHEDITFLHWCFQTKKIIFIQYNLRCLLRQDRNTKQGWYQQEVKLLNSIIQEENLKGKWTDISFSMFERSDKKFFRSSHKCREKWYNHLDPSVEHSKWSVSQDYRLFRLVSELGTKWASISKSMRGSRTQHMVKNRYNSLYKKYSMKFVRYAPKKLIDIILKDLKKKCQSDAKNYSEIDDSVKMQEEGSIIINFQNLDEQKYQSSETTVKTNSIRIEDFLNSSLLLPEWQNFEFEEVDCSSEDQGNYDYSKKMELIDYSSIEFNQINNPLFQ